MRSQFVHVTNDIDCRTQRTHFYQNQDFMRYITVKKNNRSIYINSALLFFLVTLSNGSTLFNMVAQSGRDEHPAVSAQCQGLKKTGRN